MGRTSRFAKCRFRSPPKPRSISAPSARQRRAGLRRRSPGCHTPRVGQHRIPVPACGGDLRGDDRLPSRCRTLPDVDARTYAKQLRYRDKAKRTRMVEMMILSALVLRPIPADVSATGPRVQPRAGDRRQPAAHDRAVRSGDLAMAATDFERNGYTAGWSLERSAGLHTTTEVVGWMADEDDPALAGDLGRPRRATHRHVRASGLRLLPGPGVRVPGDPGVGATAAGPARLGPCPRGIRHQGRGRARGLRPDRPGQRRSAGWSLLAMVVSLFETGYLVEGAGLFEAFPGQLSIDGMTHRIGDAMRRGALSHGDDGEPDVDFMQVDWFRYAELPLEAGDRTLRAATEVGTGRRGRIGHAVGAGRHLRGPVGRGSGGGPAARHALRQPRGQHLTSGSWFSDATGQRTCDGRRCRSYATQP